MRIYSEKASKSSYWNEYMETLPREELDRFHLRRLQQLIKHAYEKIPMYRDLYDKAGVKPKDIKTLNDFAEKIPVIDKSDVLAAQDVNPPFGDSIVKDSEEYLNYFFQTSGTTGAPLKEIGYYRDMMSTGWAFCFWAYGVRPADKIYIAFPFGTFMAFWGAYHDAASLGCQIITAGGLTTEQRVTQILELKPTVLVATPTYVMRIAEVAREMGIDPLQTSIKYIASAGEAGYVVPTIRHAVEKTWGAKTMDLYGISEMWGSTSWQCPSHPDRMHLVEMTTYGLVVDDEGKVVPDGEKGEYVLTNYVSLMPLIKYRTHDVVEWHKEKCDCGRTALWLRGGVLGRTDQMVTIKGTNVYPTAIQTIIGEIEGLSEDLEIHIVTTGGVDAVNVKIEPVAGTTSEEHGDLKTKLTDELRYRIGVSIGVEIIPPKSLPRYEVKSKRVFDHRK